MPSPIMLHRFLHCLQPCSPSRLRASLPCPSPRQPRHHHLHLHPISDSSPCAIWATLGHYAASSEHPQTVAFFRWPPHPPRIPLFAGANLYGNTRSFWPTRNRSCDPNSITGDPSPIRIYARYGPINWRFEDRPMGWSGDPYQFVQWKPDGDSDLTPRHFKWVVFCLFIVYFNIISCECFHLF